MEEKRKRIKFIICYLVFICVTVISQNSLGETCNRLVAIVNDDVITLYELNKTIEEWTGLTPEALRARNENEFIETRKQILERLIDEKITKAKIKELGIVVTPQQVDATIESIKRDNKITQEDLLAELKNRGLTFEKYREDLKKEIERSRLINAEVQSKIIIREEQLREYYQEHFDEFKTEGKIQLSSIYLERKKTKDDKKSDELMERANKIIERLEQGEDFNKLAEEVARDNGKVLNGDLGLYKESQLEPRLVDLLRKLPEGSITEPIMRPDGIQIVKLVKRQTTEVKSFDDVRNVIYTIFYKKEVEKRYNAWIEELRKHAYTKIIF